MKARKQSSTSYPILFLMVDSTDHVTGKTGLSPTVTISKNGGAFAAPSGAITELSSGWYAIAGNATDRNTLGELLIHATGAGADPLDERYLIVPFDPFDVAGLGLTYLDVAVSTRLAAAGYAAGLDAAATRAALGLASANLDTQLAALPTPAAIADATLDELLSGHVIPGSAGATLASAGAAGDPLLNLVPGAYAAGTAGYILGNLPDRAVNVVAPILTGQDLSFVHGFDYLAVDGRSEDVTVSTWPTLTGATVVLMFGALTWSVVTVTGAKTIRIAIPRALWTAVALTEDSIHYSYVIKATLASGNIVNLMSGTLHVTKEPSRA